MSSFASPSPQEPPRPLDLAQPKTLGGLISSAWHIWRARPGVFLLTALVVAVVPLIITTTATELVMNQFEDAPFLSGSNASTSLASEDWEALQALGIVFVVSMLVVGLLVPALVTATHARAVLSLASGEDLSRGEALRRGLQAYGSVLWTTLIWLVVSLIGLALCVLPGIFIGVAGAFAPMLAALGVASGWGALRESFRVVRTAGWWRTFGALIVVTIVAYAVLIIPLAVAGAVIGGAEQLGVIIAGATVDGLLQATAMSWSALATTLLFFSLKARIGEPWLRPEGTMPIEIPGGDTTPPASSGDAWGAPSGPTQTPSDGPRFVRPGDDAGAGE